jgi:cell division protein DivIC
MIKNLKKNYFLLISTFFILYFFFNLFDGERGLFSYFKKKNQLNMLKNNEILLQNKINELELNNLLLSENKNIDLDYVEILIRKKFLFGKKNESIYIIESNEN